MPTFPRFARATIAAATVLLASAALAGDKPSTSDQARAWSQLHEMKPMEVMHLVDAGAKGYVTREEFMKFQEQLFERMDRNHDGKVDAGEWMGKDMATKK